MSATRSLWQVPPRTLPAVFPSHARKPIVPRLGWSVHYGPGALQEDVEDGSGEEEIPITGRFGPPCMNALGTYGAETIIDDRNGSPSPPSGRTSGSANP